MRVSKYRPALIAFTCLLLAAASASAMDFKAKGYFRTRGVFLQNTDMQKYSSTIAHSNNRYGFIGFNQTRLRVEPLLKVNDYISILAQIDVLDDVVFGTKVPKSLYIYDPIVGTVVLPSGAGSITMVGGEAGEFAALNVRRVYMDIILPVGKLRVGRQPSNWGLGIFQNDGNEVQGDFGDTADRILFLTQYEFNDESTLSAGALWDYAFSNQHDPRTQWMTSSMGAYSKGTQQYGLVLLYDRPELQAGIFGGFRWRNGKSSQTTTTAVNPFGNTVSAGIDGNTRVYFIDGYASYALDAGNAGDYEFKAEYVYIGGKMSTGLATNAIPFAIYSGDPATTTNGIIQPGQQNVQVNLAAFEASGRYKWGGDWGFKSGFAQGDASPLSQKVTQYGFRPDYQIALLMFNYPLGTAPSLWGCNATNGPNCATTSYLAGGYPITGNFINNAIYISAQYKHHFDITDAIKKADDFSIGVRATTAWAQKNPLDLNFQSIFNNATLPILRNSSKWYGIEADVLAELKMYEHLYAAFEGGVLIPGAAYDIKVDNALIPNNSGGFETIPFSKAEITYGARVTLMVNY